MYEMLKYYKIIGNNVVLGVSSSDNFRKYQKKHRIVLLANETDAQFIICNYTFYHANWMEPIFQESNIPYETADIVEISEKEYLTLADVEYPNEMPEETDDVYEEQQEETTDFIGEITLEYAKEKTIKEMSKQCNRAITNGFDITLSDGNIHHFSLTTQDQLNILSLSAMVASGETSIPYHADGELCKYFSAVDMESIIHIATQYKTYHVTYFNSLRNYIESLQTIEDVAAVRYGDNIPVLYQSDVLKEITREM